MIMMSVVVDFEGPRCRTSTDPACFHKVEAEITLSSLRLRVCFQWMLAILLIAMSSAIRSSSFVAFDGCVHALLTLKIQRSADYLSKK